jgi:hypothetical protein
MKQILNSCTALKNLLQQDALDWPMVKVVMSRIEEDDQVKEYQGAVLKDLTEDTLEVCTSQAMADVKVIEEKIQERLEWSDLTLLRSLLVFADTQNWVCVNETSSQRDASEVGDFSKISEALEYIVSVFKLPLEAKGADLSSLQDETEEIVIYARKHLSIGTEDYRSVWYKLHTCPDHRNWPNILLVCQLVFSLPFSNGRVEQIFSSLKVIKTDRRNNLNTSMLSDLL